MNWRGVFGRGLALLAAGAAGAGLAVGGVAAFGSLGGSTTTVREIQAAPSVASAAFRSSKALSINDIYQRVAPGVVQVTSTTIVQVPQNPFFGNPFGPSTERQ